MNVTLVGDGVDIDVADARLLELKPIVGSGSDQPVVVHLTIEQAMVLEEGLRLVLQNAAAQGVT